MARRIFIIPQKEMIDDKDITDALLNNCAEISNGIPPTLGGIVLPEQLPIVYEEQIIAEISLVETPVIEMPPARDLSAEIDQLVMRIQALEDKIIKVTPT